MNSPVERSPLALEGSFPEPDLLIADLVAAVEIDGVPLGASQADNDVSGLDAPCFHCYVPPGRRQLSRYGDLDSSFVYVGAWGLTWPQANDMQKQVRALLAAYRDGGLWKGVQIHRIREATGPSALPRRPDAPDELVESGWTVDLRKHRGPTARP